jgi:hypothetical protein
MDGEPITASTLKERIEAGEERAGVAVALEGTIPSQLTQLVGGLAVALALNRTLWIAGGKRTDSLLHWIDLPLELQAQRIQRIPTEVENMPGVTLISPSTISSNVNKLGGPIVSRGPGAEFQERQRANNYVGSLIKCNFHPSRHHLLILRVPFYLGHWAYAGAPHLSAVVPDGDLYGPLARYLLRPKLEVVAPIRALVQNYLGPATSKGHGAFTVGLSIRTMYGRGHTGVLSAQVAANSVVEQCINQHEDLQALRDRIGDDPTRLRFYAGTLREAARQKLAADLAPHPVHWFGDGVHLQDSGHVSMSLAEARNLTAADHAAAALVNIMLLAVSDELIVSPGSEAGLVAARIGSRLPLLMASQGDRCDRARKFEPPVDGTHGEEARMFVCMPLTPAPTPQPTMAPEVQQWQNAGVDPHNGFEFDSKSDDYDSGVPFWGEPEWMAFRLSFRSLRGAFGA